VSHAVGGKSAFSVPRVASRGHTNWKTVVSEKNQFSRNAKMKLIRFGWACEIELTGRLKMLTYKFKKRSFGVLEIKYIAQLINVDN
jgi:hypothetical protein